MSHEDHEHNLQKIMSKSMDLEMGNFYIVEAGGNGFAARKQKKIHPKGQKQINHFCPRALDRGKKWFICF